MPRMLFVLLAPESQTQGSPLGIVVKVQDKAWYVWAPAPGAVSDPRAQTTFTGTRKTCSTHELQVGPALFL